MEFGSDALFDRIKNCIIRGQENDCQYEEIFNIINTDGTMLLRKQGVPEIDQEDILQEIQLKVLKNLARFYLNSVHESYTPEQRNSWFKQCVKSTVADFYRRNKRLISDESIEDINAEIQDPYSRRQFDRIELAASLFEAIRSISLLNKASINVMIYLLNRISSIQNTKNGKSAEIAQAINGITVEELFYEVKNQIEITVEAAVPFECLQILWEKMQFEKDSIVSVDARKITYICTKMMRKIEEMGGSKILDYTGRN